MDKMKLQSARLLQDEAIKELEKLDPKNYSASVELKETNNGNVSVSINVWRVDLKKSDFYIYNAEVGNQIGCRIKDIMYLVREYVSQELSGCKNEEPEKYPEE